MGCPGRRWCLILVAIIGTVCGANSLQEMRLRRRQAQPSARIIDFHAPQTSSDLGVAEGISPLPAVLVRCTERQLLVTVSRDLFGSGHLIQAADLTLGSNCGSSGQDRMGRVLFEVGLGACGTVVTMSADYLNYSTHLSYEPRPIGTVILRTNGAVVPIQCLYRRHQNVSSHAIKPTWRPFSSTKTGEERLAFSLRLMNDDWSAERASNVYHLGELIHIEASVETGNHLDLRVLIDRCVATLTPNKTSSPRYSIIDSNGCLVDSRDEGSFSSFVSPRAEEDKLRLLLDAFRFHEDHRNSIFITCHLKVSAAVDKAIDSMNKACWVDKSSNVWVSVEGLDAVCNCCELDNCGSSGGGFLSRGKRALNSEPGSFAHGERKAEVMVGPLVIFDYGSGELVASKLDDALSQRSTSSSSGSAAFIVALALAVAAIVSSVFIFASLAMNHLSRRVVLI
uniref:Zona pellucida sperm-binding protein 3 n=2 Tax=Callorhinchus milii TaxID=7868 RepID=A0A4W3HEG4_CALMI|eukprot:gi/632985956/ref/XP_007909972.1/ PREDICTED: zona pellucida sperm-binding protein 3-like [Callorhinchus milii]